MPDARVVRVVGRDPVCHRAGPVPSTVAVRRTVPTLVFIVATVTGGALSGCGQDKPAPRPAPVRLTVLAPVDGAVVRGTDVEVSGRVRPAGAVVTVLGRPVSVSGGTFSERVALDAGGNVIDVVASSPRARPAMVAVRIVRRLTVAVPDVVGGSEGDARAALADAGLVADIRNIGGLFDQLLPVDARVCLTMPAPGAVVDRGATVEVDIARTC
jgi:hypothetical protein